MKLENGGGQRGCAPPEPIQEDSFPNPSKTSVENTGELTPVPNQLPAPIGIAALWLSRHRDDIKGSAIAFARQQFDLTTAEAVKALQLGHALRFGGQS